MYLLCCNKFKTKKMIEYKYKKREKKFLENGHTMFEEDVLQRLKRLAHLEEQIKQGQLLPIDSVVGQSEQLVCKCQCTNSLEYSNCSKKCERIEADTAN